MRNFLDWFRTADPQTKKKVIRLLSVGVVITLICGGGVAYIVKSQRHQNPSEVESVGESTEEDQALLHKTSPYAFAYEVNQVSMAIMNRKGTQTAYAQFSLILDCPSEESKKMLTMNRAKILDSIFVVGSGFFLDDFKGQEAPKAFEKFKTLLLEKYQKEFQAQAPREISLKDWIVN